MEDAADGPQNVEYVSEQLEVKGSALEAFSDVFARFQLNSESSSVRLLPSSFYTSVLSNSCFRHAPRL